MNITPYEDHSSLQKREEDGRGFSIETIIEAWLDEVAAAPRSRLAYATTIKQFRDLCRFYGKDLIYDDPNMDVEIADFAQVFCKRRYDGAEKPISSATMGRRMATLSSFYAYAITRRHLKGVANPMILVKRPKVEAFSASEAIPLDVLKAKLAAIPTRTLQNVQDLTIILVLLNTGRRVSEISGLDRRHIVKMNDQIVLHFDRMKNNHKIDDLLSPEVSALLETCLERTHDRPIWECTGETPLWINCYHHSKKLAQERLGYHALSNMCQRWLGTPKVHTTRGTFAVAMESVGAKLTEIQRRLTHSNPAITGLYMDKLKESSNEHAGKLTELYGVVGLHFDKNVL